MRLYACRCHKESLRHNGQVQLIRTHANYFLELASLSSTAAAYPTLLLLRPQRQLSARAVCRISSPGRAAANSALADLATCRGWRPTNSCLCTDPVSLVHTMVHMPTEGMPSYSHDLFVDVWHMCCRIFLSVCQETSIIRLLQCRKGGSMAVSKPCRPTHGRHLICSSTMFLASNMAGEVECRTLRHHQTV